MRCRWHDTHVIGTYLTSSTVRCISPDHNPDYDPRDVDVEVTNNNQDFTTDNVRFSYQSMLIYLVCKRKPNKTHVAYFDDSISVI